MIKFLKITFTVNVDVAQDENGKGVWRATSESLKLWADAETPDAAVEALHQAIQTAECKMSAPNKVYVPKEIVDEQLKVEGTEDSEADEAELDKELDEEVESEASELAEAGDAAEGEVSEPSEIDADAVAGLSIKELRELAAVHGLDIEGLTKIDIRDLILKEIYGR